MIKFMNLTKKSIYIGLFGILYLIVAFSSFFHACAFFGLANNSWMSIILAFAFEVGQAAVLFSLLTSAKDRSRIMPWVLMTMFTLVQVIGNIYSSYKYIILNSVENLRYFKEPIFIWTDLPDAQANVIIVYLVGALLPIASLLLTSMITNYLTDQSEEVTKQKLDTQATTEKVDEKKDKEIEKLGPEVEQPKQEKSEENIQDQSTNKIEENDSQDDSEKIENDLEKFNSEESEYNSKEFKDNSEEIEQKSDNQSMKRQSHFINI